MITIISTDINEAYYRGIDLIKERGVRMESRNGPIIEVPCPVTTTYLRPLRRILFDSVRDCNPFFHFFESLWMLAGRNDVAFVEKFNKRMATFSDDGSTLNGAYGYRWRRHFSYKENAEEGFD